MIRTVASGVALIVLGIVVAGLGVHQLGMVRAARKWPAARPPRVGRGVAGIEVMVGIAVTATGGVLLTTLLRVGAAVHFGIDAGVVVAVLVLGMLVSAKLTDRVELNALIRSPSPLYRTAAPGSGGHPQTATTGQRTASPPVPRSEPRESDGSPPGQQAAGVVTVGDPADPAVPARAEPGWVFTDPAGTWYLCVATDRGHRLVELPGFRLTTPAPQRELRLAGTVELSVWPLTGPEAT